MASPPDQRNQALDRHRNGELDAAERLYRDILIAAPEDAETWHYLAVLHGQQGRHAEVVHCCQEALRCDYRSAAVYANLGLAHRHLGASQPAREALRQSLLLDPADADLTLEYVSLLRAAGEEREALRWIGEACSRFPADARMHAELGQLAVDLNDGQLAEESFRHAVRLQRDDATSWLNFGSILLMRGDLAGAGIAYRKALDLEPGSAQACWYLAQISGAERDPDFARQVFCRAEQASSAADAPLLFAAASLHDATGQTEAAFQAWSEGNRLIRGTFNYSVTTDIAALHALGDEVQKAIPGELPADLPVNGARPLPIFIVGMPRSGSTLLAEMLAQHPAVDSGGEIVWLQRHLRNALQQDGFHYPAEQLTLDVSALAEVRRRYVESIDMRARQGRFITDKLPGNFTCIPTIRRAFPSALILHARRDALETCWSCFRHLFAGTQRFAWDLAETASYCIAAHTFIDRCRERWPEHVLEVSYEALIEDPESRLRIILERLGLEWFPGCLTPETTPNLIQTASATQVRAGLAAAPRAHAARYLAHLQPLREALSGILP